MQQTIGTFSSTITNTYTTPAVAWLPGFQRAILQFAEWTPTRRLVVAIQFSFDGGATWPVFVESTLHGVYVDREGVRWAPSVRFDHGWRVVNDTLEDSALPTHVRATARVLDGAVAISATLILEDRPAKTGTVHHSVAVDVSTSTAATVASSLSWTHTGGSGTDRAACVSVNGDGNSVPAYTGATYGGAAMTRQTGRATPSWNTVDVYALTAIASGSQTVAATYGGGATNIGGGCTTFTGVHQTQASAFTNATTATGSSTSPSVTVSSATGDMVFVGGVCQSGQAWTPGTGETEGWEIGNGGFDAAAYTEAGAASVTVNPSLTSSNDWGMAGVNVVQAASTGAKGPLVGGSVLKSLVNGGLVA